MRTLDQQTLDDTLFELCQNGKIVIGAVPVYTGYDYNCWGFTAVAKGLTNKFSWIYSPEMERILDKHTEHVDVPEVGDIAVFRDSDGVLTHTAIVAVSKKDLKKTILIHKPGACHLEVADIEGVYAEHRCYEKVTEFRTLNKQQSLAF